MKYSDFLSWTFDNKQKTSPYQIIASPEYYFGGDTMNEPSEKDLQREYISKLLKLYPSECQNFFQYHFDSYQGKKNDFIWFAEESLTKHPNDYDSIDADAWEELIKSPKKKYIDEWIAAKSAELNLPISGSKNAKIRWKGSPEVFGYMFLELIKKGYIEPPLYNGEPNFSGFARLCGEHFDISTTPANLQRVFQESKNQLSFTKRAKFNIPELSSLD